jgi:hypothetical protein
MSDGRTPIGHMHARDFAPMREQRPLSSLTADAGGYVRFACRSCQRTGKVKLSALRERFRPNEGLVNILNTLLPKECPKAAPNPWGIRSCKFRYRDL